MIVTNPPGVGLLFASFLFRTDLYSAEELKKFWEDKFGHSFAYTPAENPLNEYYSKEMSTPLSRIFFLTANSFPRQALLATKLAALQWEKNWSKDSSRMINVDIGFLTLENFLLATTKNYSHRVYLDQNIFADLTYYFREGKFCELPWTYPDYLDYRKKDFLTWGRTFLLQIRGS